MDDGAPIYHYTPIDEGEDIRVLKLEPAISFADPLVASLFVRKLHDPLHLGRPLPTYHCVSYCWGVQRDMKYMLCNDQRLQITESVDLMLRHLRKMFTPRNLWIDAICINQNDNAEKATHVRAMGMIYQRADKVHVWLGPASVEDHIPSVFVALKTWALSSLDQHPVFDLDESQSSMVAPLRTFFARPWFTRRWIIQEVMLARNAIVHCGPHRLSWSWIRDGVAKFQSDYARNYIFGPRSNIVSTETARTLKGLGSIDSKAKSRLNILQLLWDHHSSKCEDARDCVYALYGMTPSHRAKSSSHGSQEGFEPSLRCPVDYTKHFSAVYTQLAIAAIRQGDALIVLSHAIGFGSLADQDITLPSWVPSWNKTRKSQGWPIFKDLGQRQGLRTMHLAIVESTAGTPRLVLEGTICPVAQVQIADEAENVRQFFGVSRWPIHKERLHPVRLLLRGIQDAGYLNDRTSFNFDTMFQGQDQTKGTAKDYSNTFSRLESYLRQEFGYEPPMFTEHLQYTWDDIGQEIQRMMKDYTFVVYGQDRKFAPGIASRDAQPGDYIYRPNGLAKSSEHALLLRCTKPGDRDKLGRETFRLIGYCLHSPSCPVLSQKATCTVLLE